MSVRTLHSRKSRVGARRVPAVIVAVLAVLVTMAPAWAAGPRQRKEAKLTSTQRTEYRITQDKKKMGSETVEKKVYDNNTIVFVIDATMAYGVGMSMSQHVELTVEEESYFPRTAHISKTVVQPDSSSFVHTIDLEMFSNVAVMTSELNTTKGSRRVVVPTGVAITDVGVLGYLYQTLFWYDRPSAGEQRFQYLDPISMTVNGGGMTLQKEETIPVLGKKSKVSVFQFLREKLGPATLWVDKQGTIVRAEQNYYVYELVSRKNS